MGQKLARMMPCLKIFPEGNALYRHVIIANWALLAITIILESLALAFVDWTTATHRISGCLLCLGVLAATGIWWPADRPYRVRVELIAGELVLITIASSLGASRWTWPLYLVLVARGALLLNQKDLWRLVTISYMTQTVWFTAKFLSGQSYTVWQHSVASSLLASIILSSSYGALMVIVAWLMLSLLAEQDLRSETQRLSKENEGLATELERTRIAREIHDTLGHSLTSLKLQLELAGKLIDKDEAKAREALVQAEGLAARSLTDTRVALQGIRNPEFDFTKAVQELANDARSSSSLNVHVDLQSPLPSNAAAYQLYRVVQECLTNTLKHAEATEFFVETEAQSEFVRLVVRDNGRGFHDTAKSDGLGLRGLKERIASLNGSVDIESEPGQGVRVSVKLPV